MLILLYCLQTFSIKDKTSEPQTQNKQPNRDPPTIITTAATPQDSPNTTIVDDSGIRRWDSIDSYSPVSLVTTVCG